MSSFGNAFSAARKAGKKTFSWNGKSYTTKLASSSKAPKSVPTPTPRPGTKAAPAKAKPQQNFPRPSKAVGIAKAGSPIANAVARKENAPKATPSKPAPRSSAGKTKMSMGKADTNRKWGGNKSKPKQGPTPEGVWYARKGSAMSIAAARRANRPK
jgi:hypothetical protein